MTVMEINALVGDYARTVTSMVLARCWRDLIYREQFIRNPKAVLSEEGLPVPAEIAIEVVEDTPDVLYVALPHGVDTVETAVKALRQLLPAQGHRELRLIQNTEHKQYIVIPQTPDNVRVLSEAELASEVITHRPEGSIQTSTVAAQTTAVATTVAVAVEATVNAVAAVETVVVVVAVVASPAPPGSEIITRVPSTTVAQASLLTPSPRKGGRQA